MGSIFLTGLCALRRGDLIGFSKSLIPAAGGSSGVNSGVQESLESSQLEVSDPSAPLSLSSHHFLSDMGGRVAVPAVASCPVSGAGTAGLEGAEPLMLTVVILQPWFEAPFSPSIESVTSVGQPGRASMQDLSGKVAVVTGAAGGIGLGLAQAFVDEGLRVVLADIDESRLEDAVSGLARDGANVVGVPTDVAARVSVEALRDAAVDHFGAVHILCNNAGGPFPGATTDLSDAEWDFVLGANLFGVVNGIRAFLPLFEAQGEGHLNATSSMSGLVPFPPVVAYNVAKFGVIALMETLARELRMSDSPVEASVMCPGEVATRAVENAVVLARSSGHEPAVSQELLESAQSGLLRTGIDPLEAGRITVEGIRTARFWIFTHPEWIEGPFRRRYEAMITDGSLPDLW